MSDFRSQRIKRIRRKAILTCVFSVGTAISFSTATFAWFTINRQATLQYMNIVAQDSAMVEEVNYYAVSDINLEKKSYTFDMNTLATSLGTYSRIGDGKYQVLIQIKLKDPTVKFRIQATSNQALLESQDWGEINWSAGSLPLSTVIQMTYFGPDATVDSSAKTITVSKPNPSDDKRFVTMDASNQRPSYRQSFELAPASQPASTGESCVYIMLDYYSDAITSIYSYNIGEPSFNSPYGVQFDCDFSITFIPER